MTESFLFAKLFYTQKSQVFELPVIQTVDKVPVFAGTFTMSTVFLV